MRFLYRGISVGAKRVKGEFDAQDRKQAVKILTNEHIEILALEEKQDSFFTNFIFFKSRSNTLQFTLEEICRFFEKLERLMKGGLVLSDALESIKQRSSNQKEIKLLKNVLNELREGGIFSKALNKFCNSFDSNILSILDVGDMTGNLPQALSNVIKILHRKIELKKRLIAGLSYPLFICGLAFVVILLFLFYLMPKMESMLRSFGGTLPISAHILISFTNIIIHYFPIILLFSFVLIFSFIHFCKKPKFQLFVDRNILNLPIIGRLKMLLFRTKIASAFASLLSNGIDTSSAMFIIVQSIENQYLRKQYLYAQEAIVEGDSIAHALSQFNIICGSACDILSVGEKTGDIASSFTDIADMYDEELGKFLKRLVTFSSSVALFFAFSLVSILAISIVSSVLNFSNKLIH